MKETFQTNLQGCFTIQFSKFIVLSSRKHALPKAFRKALSSQRQLLHINAEALICQQLFIKKSGKKITSFPQSSFPILVQMHNCRPEVPYTSTDAAKMPCTCTRKTSREVSEKRRIFREKGCGILLRSPRFSVLHRKVFQRSACQYTSGTG